MQNLPRTYSDFFTLFTAPPDHVHQRQKAPEVYYIGLDAEWYEDLGNNVVLSYQIATVSNSSASNIIKYVPKGKRLGLADIVKLGLDSVNNGNLIQYVNKHGIPLPIHVVVVAHNIAAEWSVLADRDEPYITKRLSLIRRSPVTDIHAIQLLIDREHSVRVWFYDTMLLAPATHQSLKKLSGLLGSDDHKIPITQHQIQNMNLFLRDDPEKYRAYALKDSEACLKLFLLLQRQLNNLVYGLYHDREAVGTVPALKLFRTLASAGVTSFLLNLDRSPCSEWFNIAYEDFDAYRSALADRFAPHLELVKRSFHGARNESFFVGDTEKPPDSPNRLWIDIDFNSCYPTAMALCPAIDPNKPIRVTAPRYRIDEAAEEQLRADNVPDTVIQNAKVALATSPEKFLESLDTIKSKTLARRVLHHAQVVDNKLLRRWQRISKGKLSAVSAQPDQFIIPGFARVRFSFPQGTQFPCLPIKHIRFGLIYPLEGECVATASEILLAIEHGARIETLYGIEFPIAVDDANHPRFLFADHLAKIVQERGRQQALAKDESASDEDRIAASVMEKLLKEFANGLYGKTAQAINARRVFRPNKRTMVPLGPSTITEPITAALTTGLARAALSSALVAVERYNQSRPPFELIIPVSATTDGLILGVARPAGFCTRDRCYEIDEQGNLKLKKGVDASLRALLKECGCEDYLDHLLGPLPIRQMRHGRHVLTSTTENDVHSFIEIKHLVDRIISIKTRGQIGLLDDGSIPLLAKFGHKPPLSDELEVEEYRRVMDAGGSTRNKVDGEWLLKQLHAKEGGEGEIGNYNFFTLTSFRAMIDSNGALDMVQKVSQRKVNVDYDWKRKVLPDTPITVPHRTVREMKVYRSQMEGIRRTGKCAGTVMVHQRVAIKGRKARFRGGELSTLVRLFLAGVLQGEIGTSKPLPPYPAVAELLNRLWSENGNIAKGRGRWTVSDLKNAKGGAWEEGIIPRSAPALRLLRNLCVELGVDEATASRRLFIASEHEEQRLSLILQVVRSVLLAPRQGIEPFRTFYLAGKFPDRQGLLHLFAPFLTDAVLASSCAGTFVRASLPSHLAPRLVDLYRRLGLSEKDATVCAKEIAPPQRTERRMRTQRHSKRCLDLFVQALAQSDLAGERLPTKTIVAKLSSFGLTSSSYYRARQGKFTPHSLANTPDNRQQVVKMAKRLRLNPVPFVAALIDE